MIRTEDGRDIVEELRNIAAGDPVGVMKINQWGEQIKSIAERAIAEIQFLRGMAGAVTKGELFTDIQKKARGGTCGCRACATPERLQQFIVCDICSNKRCPHATDHKYHCTNSNEPGQPGSIYA